MQAKCSARVPLLIALPSNARNNINIVLITQSRHGNNILDVPRHAKVYMIDRSPSDSDRIFSNVCSFCNRFTDFVLLGHPCGIIHICHMSQPYFLLAPTIDRGAERHLR